MTKAESRQLVEATFNQPFDKANFTKFISNLLPNLEARDNNWSGNLVPEAFRHAVTHYSRSGKYTDASGSTVDVLAVKLRNAAQLENARSLQRSFIARYLNGAMGDEFKDAALVAFYTDDTPDWRFSLVRMEYRLNEETGRSKKELTPARRYSFLVGKGERTHTAQQQLVPLLESKTELTLEELESAFNIETVTKEFFAKYKERFLALKEELDGLLDSHPEIAKEFQAKEIKTANFAKRLLGQIVFLYFLQKKGWLGVERGKDWGSGPKDFIQKLFRQEVVPYDNFYNQILEPLFYEALASERDDHYYSRFECRIPFLNGGLFEPINGYDWVNVDLPLKNSTCQDILETFDQYNFTVREDEPLDKEVAVDPEMLGKVFENLLEVQDRKSKGAFYTPREIVHYMCQESLINYLDTALNVVEKDLVEPTQDALFPTSKSQEKLKVEVYEERVPRTEIADFIRLGEVATENDARAAQGETRTYTFKISDKVRQHAAQLDQALADIKICDPAIGSGAFPVGMMTEIVRARQTLTSYFENKHNRTPYNFKRHAIQESIYGVDIDPSAVDIAKLRLWLSLVVDEEDFGNIKPLPNLDYKIVVGNALYGVGDAPLSGLLFDDIDKLKDDYFNETRPSIKQNLKQQIDSLLKQISRNSDTFDFRISFNDVFKGNGGFDISIANPPYIFARDSVEKGFTEQDKKFFYEAYELAEYQINLYPLFIELGFKTLRNNGCLCFITPNNWMTINTNTKLRKLILEQSNIQIINFYAKVFESASVDSSIILFQRSKLKQEVMLAEWTDQLKIILQSSTEVLKRNRDQIINIELFKNGGVIALLEKIEERSINLGEIASVKVGLGAYGLARGVPPQTKEMIENRVYHSKTKQTDRHYKYLEGRDVGRYQLLWSGEYLLYGNNLREPRSNFDLFSTERILVRQIPSKLPYSINAVLTSDVMLNDRNSMNVIYMKENPKFILGILNSRLISFWFAQKFGKLQRETFPQFKTNELSLFPVLSVKNFDSHLISKQSELISLVDKMLQLYESKTNKLGDSAEIASHTTLLDAQIDSLVYQLYGLTEEEIAIVEGRV